MKLRILLPYNLAKSQILVINITDEVFRLSNFNIYIRYLHISEI